MRLMILALLLAGSVAEYYKWRPARYALGAYAVLAAFWGMRFGQGTDYFAYFYFYTQRSPGYGPHVEKIDAGFSALMELCQRLGLSYYAFIFLIAALCTWLIYRFVRRFSPFMRLLPLFLFYAIYALPYMESGIRQCISMALFLGIILDCKWKGRYICAVLTTVVAITIHASASILLIVLFLPRHREPYERFFSKWGIASLVGFTVLCVLLNAVPPSVLLAMLPDSLSARLMPYVAASSFNILALLNRALFMGIIYFLGWKKRHILDGRTYFLLVIYTLSALIYVLFMRYAIMSRATAYSRIVEIGLIPTLLYYNKGLRPKATRAGICAIALFACFLFWKDEQASQLQGYYFRTDGVSYPYITIWNKPALLEHNSGALYRIYSKTFDPHGKLLK